MPIPSAEYNPNSQGPEKEGTRLPDNENNVVQIDFHKSDLPRELTASALGAATRSADHLAYMDGKAVIEKVEKAEELTPQEKVLRFAKQLLAMRYTELGQNLFADNPHSDLFSEVSEDNHEDSSLAA